MSYKVAPFIKDFPVVCENYSMELESILEKIQTIKEEYAFEVNINNPFIDIYILNSLVENSSVFLQELQTYYNTNLKLSFDKNLDVFDSKIFFQSYNLDLTLNLKKVFISTEETESDVYWFYTDIEDASFTNEDGKMLDDPIPTLSFLNNYFYKSKNETFSSIKITYPNEAYPIKEFLEKRYNLKSNSTINLLFGDIEDVNNNFKYSVTDYSYCANTIAVFSERIITNNLNNLLLNTNNILKFLPKNLDSVYTYKSNIANEDLHNESDDLILENQHIDFLKQELKNIDSYQIDEEYKIYNSYSGNNALNYKKLFEILSVTLEKLYYDIVESKITNLPLTEADKIYNYYLEKINNYKENYLFAYNGVVTSYKTSQNYCKETMVPLTLTEQGNCVDQYVHIEDNEKVLTKGTYKKWLQQCLDSRIYI